VIEHSLVDVEIVARVHSPLGFVEREELLAQ
jgi:hypothetical protein